MSWLDEGRKLLGAVKDFPLWLLIGLAAVADILLLAKVSIPTIFAPWLWTAAILCTVLAICRAISVGYHAWRGFKAAVAAKRTFHMSPTSGQCHWGMTKQTDGSTTTQISAHFLVKNLTAAPLGLTNVRLIAPRIRGEILHEDVSVRAVGSNMYGTAAHSGHIIPARQALPAHAHMIIRGVPKQRAEDNLQVTLGVTDDEGNEQRVKVVLRGFGTPKQPAPAPLEPVYAIKDRITKEVAAVLQSELGRYDKHGREQGGLGSVHIVYQGRSMGVGATDGWNPNSPKNQSIVEDPDEAVLQSDNLDALLAFYGRLSDDSERAQFIVALLNRLGGDIGYAPVSYFVVCTLWKVGHLKEALQQAKIALPHEDNKPFGLSNALFMLNGLLRHLHSDFTQEMLDDIEGFVHGLPIHTFQISEKIASIRARRLLVSA